MWILGAAGRAAILKLECPHCRTTHAYARAEPTLPLSCKQCGKAFTRAESEALETRGK